MTTKPTNPFEYGKDPELNRIFDSLISLRDKVANQFAKAEKIAGLGEVTNFTPLKDVKFDLPNYRYERTKNSYVKVSLDQIERLVAPAIDAARKQIDDVAAENAPLEEQNKKLVAQVTELMTRIGIPSTYTTYEYPSSRSKTKKAVSHTAGYVYDLERARPKSNIQEMKYKLDNYAREYQSWVKTERDTEMKEKIAKDEAAVQKNILGNPTLVATLMQAGVNILEEVQKAVPGQKSEVINYCKAQAIANIKAQSNPDLALIEKIQDL